MCFNVIYFAFEILSGFSAMFFKDNFKSVAHIFCTFGSEKQTHRFGQVDLLEMCLCEGIFIL